MVSHSLNPCRQHGIPDEVLRLGYRSEEDGLHDWALLWPPAEGDAWVVCIHGHGSHGDQLYVREDLRQLWLPEFRKHGLGILTPNLRDNAWMNPAAATDLRHLLNHVRSAFGARLFLFASGSMGGTSNLVYAVLHPEDVAAAIAWGTVTDLASYHSWCRERNTGVLKEIADAIEQAYRGTPEQQPELYAVHSTLQNAPRLTMPVFVAHGSSDALMPVSQTRCLAGVMAEAASFVYVEVPDGDHDSPLSCTEAVGWAMRRVGL